MSSGSSGSPTSSPHSSHRTSRRKAPWGQHCLICAPTHISPYPCSDCARADGWRGHGVSDLLTYLNAYGNAGSAREVGDPGLQVIETTVRIGVNNWSLNFEPLPFRTSEAGSSNHLNPIRLSVHRRTRTSRPLAHTQVAANLDRQEISVWNGKSLEVPVAQPTSH
jgi:hypothetical protein